jgi:hypothetical protein
VEPFGQNIEGRFFFEFPALIARQAEFKLLRPATRVICRFWRNPRLEQLFRWFKRI